MMIQAGLLDEDLLRGAMVDVAVEAGKTGPSNLHLASYSYAIIQKHSSGEIDQHPKTWKIWRYNISFYFRTDIPIFFSIQ
jgi:hypothetical protein